MAFDLKDKHWLTVTLLTRLRFVSAFQKLRVNKTNEILFVLFTFVKFKDGHS